jgi:alpha-N-arabinofuranosidase
MRGGQRVVTVETHAGHDQPVEGITVRTIPLGKEADGPIYLQIAARDGRYSLAYGVTPNHFVVIGTVDGRTLSTRTAGGFVGAVFGVFAATGE